MKTLRNILIAIICLFTLGYCGQAYKANKVKEMRIKAKYEKGEISQQEYEHLKQKSSLIQTLFSPKEALRVD